MSEPHCPGEAELLSFVDLDLPPEKLQSVERHLALCSSCSREVAELRELVACVRAPVPGLALDVAGHVELVMKRLDASSLPRAAAERRDGVGRRGWALWGGFAVAAAALALFFAHHTGRPADEFAARGGNGESSLSRDIGVQLYRQAAALERLPSGSKIRGNAALTAGLRNLGKRPAHLLLFAVDAQRNVHWIAPEYTHAGTDPQAVRIAPGSAERLLPSAVIFDDLAPGPLWVHAVLSREPRRVSEVEDLPPAALDLDGLQRRFPDAEVRQFALEVLP